MSPRLIRRLRRILPRDNLAAGKAFVQHRVRAVDALIGIRLFYAAQLFLLVQFSTKWQHLRNSKSIIPLWPVGWIGETLEPYHVDIIFSLFAVATVLATVAPAYRLIRIANFGALLIFIAFVNSFGKIGHSTHCFIYVSFILCLLSTQAIRKVGEERIARHTVLTAWMFARAAVLAVYSISGFWKLLYAFVQLSQGQRSAFAIDGFSAQIAWRLLQDSSTSLLGPFLVEHHWIAFIALWAGILFELAALSLIFLFRFHLFGGLALIGFHLSTALVLGISFDQQVLLIIVLFCCTVAWHPRPRGAS